MNDILFRCKFSALAALDGGGSGAGALAALAGKGNTAGASGGGNLAALAALAGKGNAGGGGGGNLAALAALAGKGGLGLVTKTNSLNLAFKAIQVRYFCVLKYLTLPCSLNRCIVRPRQEGFAVRN